MNDTIKFILKVDGGEEQLFFSYHSIYSLVVMEAFGKLNLPYPCTVEIWDPNLFPHFGPYTYRIADFTDGSGNRFATPSVMSVYV